MTTLKYPEDSILRRHFDTTIEFKRQLWLQTPPSDSILRRHAKGMSGNSPAPRPSATVRKHTATAPSAATTPQTGTKRVGFFARLFDMLSGRA
jgi:hypothetical protein